MTTLFDTMQPKFVPATDKLIKTQPFLEAATQTTKIYGILFINSMIVFTVFTVT